MCIMRVNSRIRIPIELYFRPQINPLRQVRDGVRDSELEITMWMKHINTMMRRSPSFPAEDPTLYQKSPAGRPNPDKWLSGFFEWLARLVSVAESASPYVKKQQRFDCRKHAFSAIAWTMGLQCVNNLITVRQTNPRTLETYIPVFWSRVYDVG